MEASIIAAFSAAKNTLTSLNIAPNIQLLIHRQVDKVHVMIGQTDEDKTLLDRVYVRPGCAMNAIKRVSERLGILLDADPEEATARLEDEVPRQETDESHGEAMVLPLVESTEPAPQVAYLASVGGSIWRPVTKIVKQESEFGSGDAAILVSVYPPADNHCDVEVEWEGRILKYSIEGEREAKMYGRKVAELILDGIA
ncbi:hypothetical protein IB277_31850 [Ensifer sp. ENS07]|uniref:hypothetical protein n=1 Tax=Ensifer sp. ENS07 TaxID=2769274 RepID=UPI00177BD113|nr:hypothetical protein [Ensifer sp. ENS07]MBD9640896.1 hypothetical protein [Ensifer sp. ENS07]